MNPKTLFIEAAIAAAIDMLWHKADIPFKWPNVLAIFSLVLLAFLIGYSIGASQVPA